ncbi:heavy metal translocating P-type ATPase [Bifidobacterium tsurumiense]|uniref:Cation-transporting ATPase V n=1 Tax=Bifidobacterium tsurumiense TaxID=356829 RepID=A0A087E9I6_9BIFI|nr:heavy metal translocating P-type ATPase [Bifidobacterium tsurumiense]KFJ04437.1 cation-transporting ATPase V [Bifidobacterium tsurumiense]
MSRFINLCKEHTTLIVVLAAALCMALFGSWRPWGDAISLPLLGNPGVGQWLVIILVLYMVIVTVKSIIDDIREGKMGVDLLAVLAMLATLSVGELWASWAVVLMVVSGEVIENYAQNKAEGNISELLKASPQEAHISNLPGIGREQVAREEAEAAQEAAQEAAEPAEGAGLDNANAASNQSGRAVPSSRSQFRRVANPEHSPNTNAMKASSRFHTVPVEDVQIGDVVVVLPGERVPVDGELLSGSATLDLSAINGEPMPREVYAGARIVSGAVNGSAVLLMRATALAQDSQYQRIVQLVSAARDSRGAAVRAADVMAVPFTVLSLIIAAAAWIVSGVPLRFAQVLVLATPCPLLIAVPVAFVAGAGRLAKAGIVVKTQTVLESLARVSHMFFDKTGTLTVKQPQVIRVDMLPDTKQHFDEDHILMMAGVVETYSVHILAKGIAKAGGEAYGRLRNDCHVDHRGKTGTATARFRHEYPVVSNINEQAGKGVSGVVDGYSIRVGRLGFANDKADGFQPVVSKVGSSQGTGSANSARSARSRFAALSPDEMASYVSVNGEIVARIVLRDVPRPNAAQTLQTLRDLGVQNITMLTGDKAASAQIVAREVGIDDVRAELFPEDKVSAVREVRDAAHAAAEALPAWRRQWDAAFSSRRDITMMVGDGVNDAPVLAAADIGVAISDGTSTAASESAEMVIMNDDIGAVSQAVRIARRTRRVMLQSVLIGLGLALACMIAAAFNLIPVVVGAFVQEAIDVISILWSLLVLVERPGDGK